MNQVTKAKPMIPVSKLFASVPRDNDKLSHGVAVSFPIIGIKGSKWHYRYRGEDEVVTHNGHAVPAIQLVIIDAKKDLTRAYYPQGSFRDDQKNQPLCWSSDGIKPDATVPAPQNPVCVNCKKSEWGSGGTAAAPKAQACQQRRRLAVVPYGADLTNEANGGPALLSVPPASLTNLDAYSKMLDEGGAPFCAVVTQFSFDPDVAFPKIEFEFTKPLDDAESQIVLTLRDDRQVKTILSSSIATDGADVPDQGATQDSAKDENSAPPKATPPHAAPPPTRKPTPRPAVNVAPPEAAPEAAPKSQRKAGGFPAGISEAVAAPSAPPASVRSLANPNAGRKLAPVVDEDEDEGNDSAAPDAFTGMFDQLMKK